MINPESIKKILWLRTDSIGDAVLASSVLPYIKKYYAQASLFVLCQNHIAELYEACLFIDSVISFDKTKFMTDQNYHNDVLGIVRKYSFDMVLHAIYSRERAIDCLATGIGASYTVAFKTNSDRDNPQLYTHLIESPGILKLELDRYKDFLTGLGISNAIISPLVWLSAEDEHYADDFFSKNGLDSASTIALFAGAQSQHRLYYYYGRALSTVIGKKKYAVIALGGDGDYEINNTNLNDLICTTFNLSGSTTLRQAAALLKRCCFALGAETGLAHIACALNIPHVVVLGGGHFGRFMPYSPLTTVVAVPLLCYGCDWRCQYKKTYCIQAVTVGMLVRAILESMQIRSNKPRIFIQGKNTFNGWDLWGPQWSLDQLTKIENTIDAIRII